MPAYIYALGLECAINKWNSELYVKCTYSSEYQPHRKSAKFELSLLDQSSGELHE